jgi:nicotinamide-nucleotide amidase
VSAEVACAMAEGALQRSSASHVLAVTGIAGPGGATPGKPVGTVWVALGCRGQVVLTKRLQLSGSRSLVRQQTVEYALRWLLAAVSF